MGLLVHAEGARAVRAIGLVETHGLRLHISLDSVIFLLKDNLRFDSLKLSLEVADSVTVGATIGATTGIGEGIAIVVLFFTGTAPRLSISPRSIRTNGSRTNCSCRCLPSSLSSGRNQHGQTWQNSEGDARRRQQTRQRGRRDRDR